MTIEGYILIALFVIGLLAVLVWTYLGMLAKEEEKRVRREGRNRL